MTVHFYTKSEDLISNNEKINEKLLDEHDYPMFYDQNLQYIQLNPYILSESKFNELKKITILANEIFSIISNVFRYDKPYLQEVFVTKDQRYLQAISQAFKYDKLLSIVGRYDWGYDKKGNLKLLEFNADTPAGLCESSFVSQLIYEYIGDNTLLNPNLDLLDLIVTKIDEYIIGNLGEKNSYKMTFACVKMATEDYYNVNLIYDYYQKKSTLKEKLILDFIDISDVNVKFDENNFPKYMYTDNENIQTDILYRFYPMEWMCDNKEYPILNDLAYLIATGRVLSINPPYTMAVHSKGVLSLLYEVLQQSKNNPNQTLFSKKHLKFLNKYILPTYLEFDPEVHEGVYVAKPFFDREGANIKFVNKDNYNSNYINKDYIYQKKMELKKESFHSHDNNQICEVTGSVVISTYSVGNDFGGILTRVGKAITDKDAYFLPTFIKRKEELIP
jgi:glutathionylspermidine synthase